MKKILCFLMAAAIVGFTGCTKDDGPSEVTLGYQPVTDVPGVSFTGNTMNASYSGVTVTLPLVDADGNAPGGIAFSAAVTENTVSDQWCTPTVEGSSLKLVIKPNFDPENGRHAVITVSSAESYVKPLQLTVSQVPYVLKASGMYILSENVGGKPASLAYYDFDTKEQFIDYFKTQNDGQELGVMSNSGIIYGSKLYIASDKSNKVSVIEAATGKLIKDVDMGQDEGKDSEPRYLTSHGGNIYISAYFGGVVKMDTTQFNIQKTAISGTYPEGICASGDNLYVANSGWGMGKTISVIDLNTFKETGTIDTPVNPYVLKAGKNGMLYLVTLGDYYQVDAQLHKIAPATKTVTTYENVTASRFDFSGKYAYTCHFSYIDYNTYIQKVDLETGTVSDFLKNSEDVSASVYGVNVNPVNGDVFYTEMSGKVSCFDQEGNLQYSLKDNGKYTNSVIFYNK